MTFRSPSSAAEPPPPPPCPSNEDRIASNATEMCVADLICVFTPFISTSEILRTQTLVDYLFYIYFIFV